jgi:hypothetical protein
MFWNRIDLLEGVDPARLADASKDAARHGAPGLPALGSFTEGRPEWVLLYGDAREGQIDPERLRRMRRADLEYLAGMTFPHPDLVAPKRDNESEEDAERRHAAATKLLGNVARAKAVLDRRTLLTVTAVSTSLGALAAGGGAVAGALIARCP